jgi:putative membrane protein
MNYAAADLHLAIAHHLLIFLLAGILAFEIGVIRLTMIGADINRVGRVDAWYGILALAIVVTGLSRAIFAAKGWGYYSINGFFWANSPRWGYCRLSPRCGS